MSPELGAYAASIRARFGLIADCVRDLAPDELNSRPAPGGNSAWVLATHTIGNARAWILGIAAGDGRRRDRPAEFASSGGDAAALLRELDRAAAECEAALASIPPERLEHRLVPPGDLWGEGEPHEIDVRRAILQVIEHASLHAGHLQVTRDAIVAKRS